MAKRANLDVDITSTDEHGFSNTMPQLLLVLLAFCEKNIVRYVLLAFSMIPVIGVISDFILPCLYVVLILMCIEKKLKFGLPEVLVPTFVVAAIAITCLMFPQNVEYIFDQNAFWNVIFPCLRWFIVGLVIIPDKAMIDLLGKVSCLAVVAESVFLIFYMIPNDLTVTDDMNRAYQLLPNVLLAVNYAFNSRKILPWIISVVGMLYLLSLGTRGPFLILTVFVVLKLFKSSTSSRRKKAMLALGIGGAGGLMAITSLHLWILRGVSDLFNSMGLSTRIIDYMLDGTFVSYTAGRDDIFETSIEKIAQSPLWGYGVYGEWQWFGWNAHNMYLELMLHYGVILGVALLVWGVGLVWKAYFKTSNAYARDIILVFACFVFVRGFFGGSYLMFGAFFLIGLCIKEKRRIALQKSIS